MVERTYFLSDLHLGSMTEPKSFVLLNFLRSFKSLAQVQRIFLLGDIFDMWLADHAHYQRKFALVVEELRRLKALGVEIHYFEGNHDMYLEHFFTRELAIPVFKGPAYFDLHGMRVRLEHGDQMDPSDWGYRLLRWFWRTPVLKWLAPRLPESVVVWIGDTMSTASREYNSSEARALSDERGRLITRVHAQKVWAQGPFDLMICGHVHVQDDFTFTPTARGATLDHQNTFQPVRVVNLGSWFDTPKVFLLEGRTGHFVGLS